MPKEIIRFVIVASAGIALWQFATMVLGTREPWDSPHYAAFYLAALCLCALFGYVYEERAWRWGFMVVFAQLPVMLLNAGIGPLLLVGLLFLSVLAMPAMVAAMAASSLRRRRRRR